MLASVDTLVAYFDVQLMYCAVFAYHLGLHFVVYLYLIQFDFLVVSVAVSASFVALPDRSVLSFGPSL